MACTIPIQGCFGLIPTMSYNKLSYACLISFLVISFAVMTSAIIELRKYDEDFHCNPGREVLKNASSEDVINEKCLRKYKEKSPILFIEIVLGLNFGIVLVFNIFYAQLTRHRVEKFRDRPTPNRAPNVAERKTTEDNEENGGESLDTPLLVESGRAGPSPRPIDVETQDVRERGCKISLTFFIYIMHLIVCRTIPLLVFATLLWTTDNPTSFPCPWHELRAMGSSTSVRITIKCETNSMVKTGNSLICLHVAIDIIVAILSVFEIVYILWLKCKDREFSTDKEFSQVYLLRNQQSIRKMVRKMKKSLNIERSHKNEYPLRKVYVDVVIQEEREHESAYPSTLKSRRKIYKSHLTTTNEGTVFKRTADVFALQENNDNQKPSNAILVIGRPGIGKSFFTRRVLHECKQQEDDFWLRKTVILLQLYKFTKDEDLSFYDMLGMGEGITSDNLDYTLNLITSRPFSTVVIFDGLEEVAVKDVEETVSDGINPKKKMPVFSIIKMLVNRRLLPGVKVLVTSRSTTQCISPALKFYRIVEIVGFSKEQIETYVRNFCQEEISELIWNQIERSKELLSLCYIPANTYVVCSTLKEIIEDDEGEGQRDTPNTITELYKRATKVILHKHHPDLKKSRLHVDYLTAPFSKDHEVEFEKLEYVAINRFLGERFPFKATYEEFGTQENCGFFHKLEPDTTEGYYIFLHMAIQEFLVAAYLIKQTELKEVLQAHVDDSKWHLVIQFIAGLLGDELRRAKTGQKNCLRQKAVSHNKTVIDQILKRFEEWAILLGSDESAQNEKALLGIKCLYELQEIEVMKSVAKKFRSDGDKLSLNGLRITPVDSAALFEFIGNSTNIKQLEFRSCKIKGTYSYEKMKQSLLNNPAITSFKSIDSLTDGGVKHLSDALTSNNCKLTELELRGSDINDKSVEHITDALKEGRNKLDKLYLGPADITDEGVKRLCECLKLKNCNITALTLSEIKLTDEGVGYLGDFLKNSKLSEFHLKMA